MLVQRIRLTNFKGFSDFTVHVKGSTYLVGPNNAGKSTIIGSLRLAAGLLAHAKRIKPRDRRRDDVVDREYWAYPLLRSQLSAFEEENVRHEFREVDARIEIFFSNGAKLVICWPNENPAFFYLEHVPGAQPPILKVVRDWYPTIGVVQALAPLEHGESLLSEAHVRENLGTRLASRHFRNQLYHLMTNERDQFDKFLDFALGHTPEITRLSVARSAGYQEIDVYYVEAGSKTEKELYWAGDGVQIWLQLLYHLWRQEAASVLVLDEPDVYLHPDLQRRLVRVVDSFQCQVILATHAPEILAEAGKDSVVIIDRSKKRSKRVVDDAVLSDLNYRLGSGFNLKLARALRSKVALFVEGKDMKVLRHLAQTVGASLVAAETGLTVVQMGGASNRELARSFGWINETLLDSAVQVCVFLDRDYLADESIDAIKSDFSRTGVSIHVWERKELESYLLIPSAIARCCNLAEEDLADLVSQVLDDLKSTIFSRQVAERIDLAKPRGVSSVTVIEQFQAEFDRRWNQDPNFGLFAAPAKDVLTGINRRIQENGMGKTFTVPSLARRIASREVPEEMRNQLLRIDGLLS